MQNTQQNIQFLTPCTQGCWRTWAALRRFLASRTSSLEMRSLALEEIWAHSFSGNSYLPSWMLSNKVFWEKRRNKRWGLLSSFHWAAHEYNAFDVGLQQCAVASVTKRGWVLYLACLTRFSVLPSTVTSTTAHEGRVTAQHDVEDDAQTPQITALIVDCGLLVEGFHNFRRHVFGRSTLRWELEKEEGGVRRK